MNESNSGESDEAADERSSSSVNDDKKIIQRKTKRRLKRKMLEEHEEQEPALASETVPSQEDDDEDDNDDDDYSEAECVPNSTKSIECFICSAEMSKIHKLRAHMQLHAHPENYEGEGKGLETAPIYNTLNPHRRNIEPQVIRDFLVQEVKAKRYSQFYGILSEAGVELNISDSETESEDEQQQLLQKANVSKLIPRNTYKCDLCAVQFERRYQALFHQKTAHSRDQLQITCDYCGRGFCGVQLLIHHLKTQCESDEHPISCVERFRQHLLQSNLQEFECLAEARKAVKIHRLTTAEKVYACGVCSKTFLRQEHLTRHKAVHLPDELKMDCPVCYKKFNRKDNLRTHMKVHMDEAERDATNHQSTILCQYCGHCFTSKSNYVVHMRRHTGEMPYTCEVCGKGFPKSTDLNSHKITHTGERNFKCSVCQKAFARSAVLSKHMRVHAGPYHCTYCDQSFTRPNELATHLRRHAAGQAFACAECASSFSTKEQLTTHQQTAGHTNKRIGAEKQETPTTQSPPEVVQTELTAFAADTKAEIIVPAALAPPATCAQHSNTFSQGPAAETTETYLSTTTTQPQVPLTTQQQQSDNLYPTQWQ